MNSTAPRTEIRGRDVVALVERLGGEVELSRLRAEAIAAFGLSVDWTNCHGDQFDFDGLVRFLAVKGKLEIDGTTIRMGPVPPCTGH